MPVFTLSSLWHLAIHDSEPTVPADEIAALVTPRHGLVTLIVPSLHPGHEGCQAGRGGRRGQTAAAAAGNAADAAWAAAAVVLFTPQSVVRG